MHGASKSIYRAHLKYDSTRSMVTMIKSHQITGSITSLIKRAFAMLSVTLTLRCFL
jgi:hypothetical protein